MLERILERRNLNNAYKRVKQNHGAGGVDGMSVEELGEYLVQRIRNNYPYLTQSFSVILR